MFNILLTKAYFVTAVAMAFFTINACRPKQIKTTSDDEGSKVAKLHKNALSNEVSSFITHAADSPIHWQAWEKSLFTDAASERKTVLALIGSGTDPKSLETLNRLNRSAVSCALLNKNHVNVLIDSNVHPDLEFMAAYWCMQSSGKISTPMLVWFSNEGNPVSWIPVDLISIPDFDELISRMSNTVYRIWRDDAEYVINNSRQDYQRRFKLIVPDAIKKKKPQLTIKAVRQTASYFNPTKSTVDGFGKISVARYIGLLTTASHHPDISNRQKKQYANVATQAAEKILLRGLIDPLDGGAYSGIQQTSTALPVFSKTLKAQAFAMKALYSLYQITGKKLHLDAADATLAYTEKHLALPDGGYFLGINEAGISVEDNPSIWTFKEIESVLTDEELRICTLAFGISKDGNIPMIDDRKRDYFRKNTLTLKLSSAELAKRTSLDPITLNQHLTSITKKLAKLRNDKPQKPFKEKLSTAGANALYASSCISAYRATGNTEHLTRATGILTFIRNHFIDKSGKLHRARYNGKLQNHPGTGNDHALVSAAALDLYEVSLESEWLKFATETHRRMNLLLADPVSHQIIEYDGTDYPFAYNIPQLYSLPAIDNLSTWAIAYSNGKRLLLQVPDDNYKAQCESLRGILFGAVASSPIASIDFLTADARLHQKNVYLKTPAAPALLQTAVRKPCNIIPVTSSKYYPELGKQAATLTEGTATVTHHGKIIGTATTPEELVLLLSK